MRIFLVIVLSAVVVGCDPTIGTQSTTTGTGSLDETKVLAIARAAVTTNDTWID